MAEARGPPPARCMEEAINPLVFAYTGMGRKDQTIALLQKAYAEHSNVVPSLRVDPRHDWLRGDPRFQELLRSLKFSGG